jgi:hypothetical protein
MQITDMLVQTGGLQSMARELGVSETQAEAGAAALVPAILVELGKQEQLQPSGAAGLGGVLQQLGGASLLDDVLSPRRTNVSRGNDVLGRVFGSKEVSRAVAQNAATQTGLDPSLLRKMLPIVGMLVTGVLAKQGGTGTPPSSPRKGDGRHVGWAVREAGGQHG